MTPVTFQIGTPPTQGGPARTPPQHLSSVDSPVDNLKTLFITQQQEEHRGLYGGLGGVGWEGGLVNKYPPSGETF